jgi:hypothetical protein
LDQNANVSLKTSKDRSVVPVKGMEILNARWSIMEVMKDWHLKPFSPKEAQAVEEYTYLAILFGCDIDVSSILRENGRRVLMELFDFTDDSRIFIAITRLAITSTIAYTPKYSIDLV